MRIIDLEDIIEMPARPIDEDEDLDLDVDIFDVDSDLEPEPEKPAQKAAPAAHERTGSKARLRTRKTCSNHLEMNSEEDEKLFEPVASRGTGKESLGESRTTSFR